MQFCLTYVVVDNVYPIHGLKINLPIFSVKLTSEDLLTIPQHFLSTFVAVYKYTYDEVIFPNVLIIFLHTDMP